jgi:hypothetical protein
MPTYTVRGRSPINEWKERCRLALFGRQAVEQLDYHT